MNEGNLLLLCENKINFAPTIHTQQVFFWLSRLPDGRLETMANRPLADVFQSAVATILLLGTR